MNGRVVASLVAALAAVGGCASDPLVDPSFALSYDEAERVLTTMRDASTTRPTLARPIVILDGIGSWGLDAATLKRRIADRADGSVITLAFPFEGSFDACRQKVIAAVDRAFGQGGDRATVEVDVVGLSLGGVVARFASLDDPTLGKRLNVRRLFTIASPLQGARFANGFGWLSPIRMHRDLRSTSAFYKRLASRPTTYPVVSYSRLGDPIVGARHASMPGAGVYWLANRPFESAHGAAFDDPRIVADLLKRLRGEPSLTAATPSPLPDGVD